MTDKFDYIGKILAGGEYGRSHFHPQPLLPQKAIALFFIADEPTPI
ncbi:hypothetical protein QUA30_07800 [Microcoleus sp. Pol14C2]